MLLSIMIFHRTHTSSCIASNVLEEFGAKGIAISFISNEPEQEVLDKA